MLIYYFYLLRNLNIKLKLKLIDFYFISFSLITIVVNKKFKKTLQNFYIAITLLKI